MSVKTYDPAAVALSVGGIPISGFADGEFINVERDGDAFSKVVGADGETSRAKSNNRSGSITITLAQTSASNDVLSALALLDENTNTGIVPILCKEGTGRAIHFSALGWIRKPAAAGYGNEISNREWVLDLADYTPGNAGTAEFEPA